MKLHMLCLAAATVIAALPAQAATTIVGDAAMHTCARIAAAAPSSSPALNSAIGHCNDALTGKLRDADRTATLVNRGILRAASGSTDAALRDFDTALARDAHLASAYVSRGAALMQVRRFTEAQADFSRALALGPAGAEKIYFNRGMAHEQMGDLRAAYDDYRQAAMLAPEFAAPRQELARFQLVQRRVARN